MRLSTSSSVILATLASSVSFGQLAAAAPTDDTVSNYGLNGVSGFGGSANPLLGGATVRRSEGAHQRRGLQEVDEELNSLGLPSPGAKRDLEVRQLGGVTDMIAAMLPGVIDNVLGLLGLQRSSLDAAAVLPEAVSTQIATLVKQATGTAGSLPVVGGVLGPASGALGSVTGREDPGPSAPPPSPSSPAPGPPAAPAPPGLPVSGLPFSLPVPLPVSTGMVKAPVPPALPVQPPNTPVSGALPLLFGPSSNTTAPGNTAQPSSTPSA